MIIPANTHVAVIDGARFVLFRNVGSANNPALETLGEPDLHPTNRSQGKLRHSITTTPEAGNDLDEAAHVAAAAEWLNQAVLTQQIDDLIVVADKRSLGELRRHYHKELEARLRGEVGKVLTSAPIDQIERAITEA
ncbi:MAG: host attachment protein [Sphingomonadaceae bacterium]